MSVIIYLALSLTISSQINLLKDSTQLTNTAIPIETILKKSGISDSSANSFNYQKLQKSAAKFQPLYINTSGTGAINIIVYPKNSEIILNTHKK